MAASFGVLLALFGAVGALAQTAVTKTEIVGDWICVDLQGGTRKESTESWPEFEGWPKTWLGTIDGACDAEYIEAAGLRSIYGLTTQTGETNDGRVQCAYFAPTYVESRLKA